MIAPRCKIKDGADVVADGAARDICFQPALPAPGSVPTLVAAVLTALRLADMRSVLRAAFPLSHKAGEGGCHKIARAVRSCRCEPGR